MSSLSPKAKLQYFGKKCNILFCWNNYQRETVIWEKEKKLHWNN